MIAHFRRIFADAFDTGDLPKGKVGRHAKVDNGSLPRRQLLDQEGQPTVVLAGCRRLVGPGKGLLGDLIERDRALASPAALEGTGLVERDATEPTPE
jgi:hypothetical protein